MSPLIGPAAIRRHSIYADFTTERHRQEKLKAEGRFKYSCADHEQTDDRRLGVLAEEFGEVSRAINEDNPKNLEEELIQVGAVVTAWLEHIRS